MSTSMTPVHVVSTSTSALPPPPPPPLASQMAFPGDSGSVGGAFGGGFGAFSTTMSGSNLNSPTTFLPLLIVSVNSLLSQTATPTNTTEVFLPRGNRRAGQEHTCEEGLVQGGRCTTRTTCAVEQAPSMPSPRSQASADISTPLFSSPSQFLLLFCFYFVRTVDVWTLLAGIGAVLPLPL